MSGEEGRDFAIGSAVWPGMSKLIEEMGELGQVLGKLIATGGDREHWDGSDLRERLIDELADVQGALSFFRATNLTNDERVQVWIRADQKRDLFGQWHREQQKTPAQSAASEVGEGTP